MRLVYAHADKYRQSHQKFEPGAAAWLYPGATLPPREHQKMSNLLVHDQ